MNGAILLANMIWVFHILVILFVLLAPFTNIPGLLILHVTFSISLLVHWYGNSNECSLTLLESQLRGLDKTQSFTHQFIAPVYDISKTEWSTVCYTVTIILLGLSLYKLYNSQKIAEAYNCYKRQTNNQDLTFYDKVVIGMYCFRNVLSLTTVA